MIKLTISGRPASKKNSKRVVRNHATGRVFVIPSKGYEAFNAAAVMEIKLLMKKNGWKTITLPIRVDYYFFQKGKLKQDFDNAIGSINDVLQDAGLIADDDLIVRGTFEKVSGCKDWETIVTIRNLD